MASEYPKCELAYAVADVAKQVSVRASLINQGFDFDRYDLLTVVLVFEFDLVSNHALVDRDIIIAVSGSVGDWVENPSYGIITSSFTGLGTD